MEAILVSSITKAYAGTRVLAEATLAVGEGERVVIFGPTGSGKTTLLYVLAGLVRPDAGRVRLFGQEASGNGCSMPPEARRIGMVFQRALLWPHMNARGNVEFALYRESLRRTERKSRALEAMALFGVEDLAERRPETLSGGQAQRVALARSVAARPKILLWDEPFTGLDGATRDDAAASAVEFARRMNTTIIAVSHHAEDAEALEARRLVIKDGILDEMR